MSIGITNTTVVTLNNITSIANVTTYHEFLINVNHTIYNGYLYFALLLVSWIILFIGAQYVKDQFLNNLMYTGSIITIISFILRAITITDNGLVLGLITDKQMWLFPLLTIFIAGFIWMTKQD